MADLEPDELDDLGIYDTGSGACSCESEPPVVTNVVPTPGTSLAPRDSVSLDVTDDVGLRRVMLIAKFPHLTIWEVVHDGDDFALNYRGISTKDAITGGSTYVLRRVGGWPDDSVTIEPVAIDTSGNEATAVT